MPCTVVWWMLGMLHYAYKECSQESSWLCWAYVTLSSLQTIIVEIKANLNNCPLPHGSSDINEPKLKMQSHLPQNM